MFYPVVEFLITCAVLVIGIALIAINELLHISFVGSVRLGFFIAEAALIGVLSMIIYHAPLRLIFIG